jgi:predicted Zn-dependent peptidase
MQPRQFEAATLGREAVLPHLRAEQRSLAIAGDVSTGEVVELVSRYFGELPPARPAPLVSCPTRRSTKIRRIWRPRAPAPLAHRVRSARQYTEEDG